MAFTSSVVNALSRRGGLVCEKANPFIFVSESVTRKKKLGGGGGVCIMKGVTLKMSSWGFQV